MHQIHKVCNLNHRSSAGFQWRYDEDNIESLDDVTDIVNQCKTVFQFNLSGELLYSWTSVYEAAKQFTNITSARANIKRNCEGFSKQALNYYWSYQNKFIYCKDNKNMPVAAYSKDGNFIKSYVNIQQVAEELNCSDTQKVFDAISGKIKTYNNFRWRFFYGNTNAIKPLKTKIQSDLTRDSK